MNSDPVEAAIEAMTPRKHVWDEKVAACARELVDEGLMSEGSLDAACELITNQLEEVLEHSANYRALFWAEDNKDEERMRHE